MATSNKSRSQRFYQVTIYVVGSIVLAVVGNALYEMLVRPGLSLFGRFLLNTVTLGSHTVKDAAYASAAIDPSVLPSLLMISILVSLPAVGCFTLLFIEFLLPEITKKYKLELEKATDLQGDERAALLTNLHAKLDKKGRNLTIGLSAYLFVLFVMLFVGFSVLNQSVVIWRIFHANLNIVTPVISADERNNLVANFSAMKTREDYLQIDTRIKIIAAAHQLKLREEEPW